MENDDNLLKNRLTELSRRSYLRGIWTYSNFLSLAEQDILYKIKSDSPVSLNGGYEMAERKIAVFGSIELCGWEEEIPVQCVKIAPVNRKFEEVLTHRDFLGSLMGLGIRRDVMGDIEIRDNSGYLFCLSSISEFVISELHTVRHTTVNCSLTEPPDDVTAPPEISYVSVSSERLDALVSAVYGLSRSSGQELISEGKVFLSGRQCISGSCQIEPGTIVSVRGKGRFIYEGTAGSTRRGRLHAAVRIY